jgi:ABC-2 type transport system permease protein
MKSALALTRKELNSYFSSPMALIFVAVFLAATLFTFFWVDEFFARGIADLRPMFRWMPTLLIFLAAALTMRQWSEEQQTGTLEILFTMPMKLYQLVLGKFFAALILVAVALALTLFLPISVASMGNPDPGPIIGGYLATLLLASSYLAIGLFISSRTSNQIVSLILTIAVCGVFQLIGSSDITGVFNSSQAEILRAFGTGSRFASIERGVIDLRDLIYYLTLTIIFLMLNTFSLDMKRWGKGISTRVHRLNSQAFVSLVAVNLVVFNVFIYPIHAARVDLTEDHEYSLSDATRDLLSNLQEPLLIRGYFSEKNHPLLAPLIPRIRDMLDEYRIAAGGKLDVEIVDPIKDPEKEAEANQVYGITPTPLQVTDRYGASVLNVYFDILIRYGDQDVTLNFGDLIEVDQYGGGDVEVRLRNLEYDLTRSIKKVVYGFRSVDSVLASLDAPAQLTLYYTPDTLPDTLQDAPGVIQQVADKIASDSNGKFVYQAVDVNDPANGLDPDALYNQYGIRPIAQGFFASETFYLHMVLAAGDKVQVIYPGGDVSEAGIRDEIESALQRAAPGFLKVVGVWTPPATPQQDMFGQPQQPLQTYQTVTQALRENYDVQAVSLTTGEVPTGIDVLMIIQPENLTEPEKVAIDQFLMRGGTVFVAAGNFKIGLDQFGGGLTLFPIEGGMQDMLAAYGITVDPSVVLDPQNAPFPVQVTRNVSGMQVQEIQALDYPFFVDVRQDQMDRHSPILSRIPSLIVSWASPVTVDGDKNADRSVTTLMKSTDQSWSTTSTNIQPNLDLYPQYGFPVEGEQQAYPLAVVVEGSFDSFFKDNPPAATDQSADPGATDASASTGTEALADVNLIESSPDTARLIVVGSSEFLNDTVFQLASSLSRDSDANALQFLQNTVDWATEDTDLLSIRARGTSARVLDSLTDKQETQWEAFNYAAALISLVVLGGVWQWRKRAEKPIPLVLPQAELVAHEGEAR